MTTHASMTHPMVGAAAAEGRRIRLSLADGSARTVDASALLTGPVFADIADIAAGDDAFGQLFLDGELGTVCWPGEVDLAPEALLALPDVSGTVV